MAKTATASASERPIPDKAVFNSGFGRWAMMLDKHTEADPVGVLVSLMAYFATYIGRHPGIKSKSRKMQLSFWPNLIGYASIGHKGTATALAGEVAASAGAIPAFAAENVMRIPDSGLGLLLELDKRKDLSTNLSKPTLVIEPEMGTKLIPVLQRDGRFSAALTTLWDGEDCLYSSGNNQVEIKQPHMSIIGHVQPDLLEGTKKGNAAKAGVWTRFFGVWVTQSKELDWFDDDPDIAAKVAAVGALFGKAAKNARDTGILTVPAATRAAVASHHRPKVMALLSSSRSVRVYCERLPAYMLRIAALNALSDNRDWISVEDFDAALALCKYSVESMIHMLQQDGAGENKTTLAMKIQRHIAQNGATTLTDLKAACGGHNSKAAYTAAFIELKTTLCVYTYPRRPGQRGAIAWVIGPEVPDGCELVDLEAELHKRDPKSAPPPPEDDGEIIVEATVIREDTETEPEPRKAISPPKPPKTAARSSQATTEPPKRPEPSPEFLRDYARLTELVEKEELTPEELAELEEIGGRMESRPQSPKRHEPKAGGKKVTPHTPSNRTRPTSARPAASGSGKRKWF